jgi:hypothetical protein
VKFGKVQLLLNAGDHAHMKQAFEEVLHQVDLEYSIVPDMAGVEISTRHGHTGTRHQCHAVCL